jgi:peptidoglycan/xylan/chitin deacetylase (PgdA/CDA1 family)
VNALLWKTTVKRALCSSGVLNRLARRGGASFILAAHVVLDEDAEPLSDLIRLLGRAFSVVSMDEYVAALRDGKCRNLLALTFDDGLRNQLTVAHEVLVALRAPATFYVCPALVGAAFSTWTWELEPRLSRLPAARRQALFRRASTETFESFLQALKEMPVSRREALWQDIVDGTPDFAFDVEEERLFGLMDWRELSQLDQSLIAIGSHTHTHADLPQLDDERLESELAESKATLRAKLGYDARHFAYPNGNHDNRTAHAVARHFGSGVTMVERAVGPNASPYRLPRVHVRWSAADLAWTLARAARG